MLFSTTTKINIIRNFGLFYHCYTDLVRQLTAIAREELEHFEQVNQWLERLQIPLAPLKPPPYGARLKAEIRSQEPERFLAYQPEASRVLCYTVL